VRTAAGRKCVLKQIGAHARPGEVATLRAASGSGATATFIEEIEPGLYLAEWLSGPTLAGLPLEAAVDVRAIGRTVLEFHGITPPPGLSIVGRSFFARRADGWRNLPQELRSKAHELSALLEPVETAPVVLLHGDLAPSNVIKVGGGWRFIDPAGLVGPAAWDLAQLAVTAAGRGRRRFLAGLMAGYAREPPHLAEMLAWMVLHYLDKNLGDAASPFTAHLRPLAESLAASDPQQFYQLHLAE
jgi:hypothetical protein